MLIILAWVISTFFFIVTSYQGELFRHHLELSITAQKKDVNDPLVINEFAALVGDQFHLDALYLLTVADLQLDPELHKVVTALYSSFAQKNVFT